MSKKEPEHIRAKVAFIKRPDDPLGLRISAGMKDDTLYLSYRGGLEQLRKALHILNEFVQMQRFEAPLERDEQ